MYIIGINGSPRAGGNSDILLDEALRGAVECGARAEKIFLNALKYVPCQECENVTDEGICSVRDEMDIVYAGLKKADAVILSSPIFFGSLSAQTKMMIDRFQCAWLVRRRLKRDLFGGRKACAFVSVQAGDRDDFFQNARSIVRNWCATINARYEGELFCAGVEERGSVRARSDCIRAAFELGRRLASAEV
ncbi:MAG: flavodoxin family protein [bacterium]|jgi:multimeric flavodoxin WrbA